MKYGRPAVAVGLVAGALSAAGSAAFPSAVYHASCGIDGCVAVPGWIPTVIGALGILLVFDSFLSLVGPTKIFYGMTVVSILIVAVSAVGTPFEYGLYLWPTLVLAVAAAALSFLAARSKTGFTEQSNPMNLPVFG